MFQDPDRYIDLSPANNQFATDSCQPTRHEFQSQSYYLLDEDNLQMNTDQMNNIPINDTQSQQENYSTEVQYQPDEYPYEEPQYSIPNANPSSLKSSYISYDFQSPNEEYQDVINIPQAQESSNIAQNPQKNKNKKKYNKKQPKEEKKKPTYYSGIIQYIIELYKLNINDIPFEVLKEIFIVGFELRNYQQYNIEENSAIYSGKLMEIFAKLQKNGGKNSNKDQSENLLNYMKNYYDKMGRDNIVYLHLEQQLIEDGIKYSRRTVYRYAKEKMKVPIVLGQKGEYLQQEKQHLLKIERMSENSLYLQWK